MNSVRDITRRRRHNRRPDVAKQTRDAVRAAETAPPHVRIARSVTAAAVSVPDTLASSTISGTVLSRQTKFGHRPRNISQVELALNDTGAAEQVVDDPPKTCDLVFDDIQ